MFDSWEIEIEEDAVRIKFAPRGAGAFPVAWVINMQRATAVQLTIDLMAKLGVSEAV